MQGVAIDTRTKHDSGRTGKRTAEPAEDELVLPWYYSWWRVGVLAVIATLLVVAAVGAITDRTPGADSVDVGFLQDMRSHHDQAVQMSLSMLFKDDIDPTLRTIAAEILLAQQQETGIMVEILRTDGAEEENSSGTSMGWMNQPVPTDRMPGMANADELGRLDAATGTTADRLFVELMIAHHQGGIAMAEYAADHAETDRVTAVAEATVRVQQGEVEELQTIATRLGFAG